MRELLTEHHRGGVVEGDGPGAIPNPGRVPEQELLSPELGFLVAAALRCVSGEKLRCSDVLRSGANI